MTKRMNTGVENIINVGIVDGNPAGSNTVVDYFPLDCHTSISLDQSLGKFSDSVGFAKGLPALLRSLC